MIVFLSSITDRAAHSKAWGSGSVEKQHSTLDAAIAEMPRDLQATMLADYQKCRTNSFGVRIARDKNATHMYEVWSRNA